MRGSGLNDMQLSAVMRGLQHRFSVVQGPPGVEERGKGQTWAQLIRKPQVPFAKTSNESNGFDVCYSGLLCPLF